MEIIIAEEHIVIVAEVREGTEKHQMTEIAQSIKASTCKL